MLLPLKFARSARLLLLLMTLPLLASCNGQAVSPPQATLAAPPATEGTPALSEPPVAGGPSPTAIAQREIGTLTVAYQAGAKAFDFQLFLPPAWAGQYEVQQAEESQVAFLYVADPSAKVPLFTLHAIAEASWAERQAERPALTQVHSLDGVIFAYAVAGSNPYEGTHADTFDALARSVPAAFERFEASRSDWTVP